MKYKLLYQLIKCKGMSYYEFFVLKYLNKYMRFVLKPRKAEKNSGRHRQSKNFKKKTL